ncbi:short-chain dehydrogenase [Lentinus tigrinus ALCF2SS1-7]|uniref:Short-chain dehydrogenase n=1 Tax=Lentinus tigrinus ALCF2SS1-6 TaxID=1328759 RepID=A0A5C2SV96_9APHY|nr:short-chain dehydrogenase [Lentinus tigrinus ALCF2SS1-6]RPD81142.1 short-chain dehydrogenase [Lentinus tigrinus ALCF2SS1-7]
MAARPTVLLTGASKGLGLAIAKILLEKFNANVVALSRTKGPDLQSLVDSHKDALLALECDVTNAAAVGTAVSQGLEKYKSIDGVILNAGVIEPLGTILSEEVSIDQWKQHFDVNFFSLVSALRATVPVLRKSAHGGRVVFMSSGAATGNVPTWGPYNAGKAAMNSLCRTIAAEEPDLTFVAMRPGMVNTPMQAVIREQGPSTMPAATLKIFTEAFEQNKLVAPEDAGHVAAALALTAPRSLSGQFVSWDAEECKPFRR